MRILAAVKAEGPGLAIVEQALPAHPGPGEVRVRMLHGPVNPADMAALDGRYTFPTPPGTPLGAEGSGIVEAVGEGVSGLAPGDLVLPLDRGNWASHRQVNASRLVRVPAGTDPRRAALLRINPPTAWLLLRASLAAPGETIVQNGGRSSVAAWVRAFAAAKGIGVASLARNGGVADDGTPLVADESGIEGEIAAALDCVAGPGTGRLATRVREGGRIIVFGHLSGEPISIASQAVTGRDLTLRGLSLRREEVKLGEDEWRRMWEDVFACAAQVMPERRVEQVLSLTDLPAYIASPGESKGRVLVTLS